MSPLWKLPTNGNIAAIPNTSKFTDTIIKKDIKINFGIEFSGKRNLYFFENKITKLFILPISQIDLKIFELFDLFRLRFLFQMLGYNSRLNTYQCVQQTLQH